MGAERELRRALQKFRTHGSISRAEALELLVYFRQILEHDRKLIALYPQIYLFANWAVHNELKRSLPMLRHLRDFSRMLSKFFEKVGSGGPDVTYAQIHEKASSIVDIPAFRRELVELSRQIRADRSLFTTETAWTAFVQQVLALISEKPIRFPDEPRTGNKSQQKIYDLLEEIMELPAPENQSTRILGLDVGVGSDGHYVVALTTASRTRWLYDLSGKEKPEDFES